MIPLLRGILLIVLLALGGRVTFAQTLATYGDAPGAEAAGAADAANRAANGGPVKADDDAQLLGGPAAYGDVYQARTTPGGPQLKLPAAGANGQGQGATSFEHMLNDPDVPQQAGNLKKAKAGAPGNAANVANAPNAKRDYAPGAQQPGAGNAALQLYGDGTASGATRHEIYKSPW
jgi:hypothetical protein